MVGRRCVHPLARCFHLLTGLKWHVIIGVSYAPKITMYSCVRDIALVDVINLDYIADASLMVGVCKEGSDMSILIWQYHLRFLFLEMNHPIGLYTHDFIGPMSWCSRVLFFLRLSVIRFFFLTEYYVWLVTYVHFCDYDLLLLGSAYVFYAPSQFCIWSGVAYPFCNIYCAGIAF